MSGCSRIPVLIVLVVGLLLRTSSAKWRSWDDDEVSRPSLRPYIDWMKCLYEDDFECGQYDIPLDWHNASAGSGTLSVMRYKARSERRGVIFINSGYIPYGPGQIWMLGDRLGGMYDLVTWSVRGTPGSSPFRAHHPYYPRELIPEGSKLSGRDEVAHYYETHERFAKGDLVSLADYLDGPGVPINFWGQYQGSLIGSYLIQMFPNRVGHIVLDEPIDPVEYIERSSFPTWLDRVVTSNNNLKSFAVACAEPNGPGCPTAMRYRNENDILREAIQGLAVARVAHTSQVRRSEAHPDHQIFEDDLARGLRSEPAVWDFSSSVYQGLSLQTSTSQGFSKFVVNLQWQLIKLESHDFENWMTPTICGDKAEPFLTNISSLNAVKEEIINNVLSVHHDSPLLGRSFPAAFYLCHMWPTRATERYLGPWDHQPANPVLVIGSKLSVTGSYDHALAVAEQLGDAAVFIEQGGLGDVFGYSKRLQNIITEYLRDGTVPTEDARLVSPK